MKRRRFFVAPEGIEGSRARLSEEESHHLRDVLRLSIGAPVELFDGQGGLYQTVVRSLGSTVELEILLRSQSRAESPLQLVVGQSLVKGGNMEWIFQKCTELGVAEFVPLETQFSEVHLPAAALRQRHERWRRVVVSAAKQCRRGATPLIHPACSLSDLCARVQQDSPGTPGVLPYMESFAIPDLRLVVSERGGLPAKALSGFQTPSRVLVVVGPEGGWSQEETALFQDSGFHQVSLGPRILRSETAAVTIASVLQFLWGDLAG